MKFRHRWAACALAIAVAATAGQANAACTWGQNTVTVMNRAVMAPLLIPVKAHARWRVGDSMSEWINVPVSSDPQRVYGWDYPLMVDVSLFTGLDWFTLGSADVLASVRGLQAEYAGRCAAAGNLVIPLSTYVIITLSDEGAGKGVMTVRTVPDAPMPPPP